MEEVYVDPVCGMEVTPETAADSAEPGYIADIGLSKHLSPTRSNGLGALLEFIRARAQQAQ